MSLLLLCFLRPKTKDCFSASSSSFFLLFSYVVVYIYKTQQHTRRIHPCLVLYVRCYWSRGPWPTEPSRGKSMMEVSFTQIVRRLGYTRLAHKLSASLSLLLLLIFIFQVSSPSGRCEHHKVRRQQRNVICPSPAQHLVKFYYSVVGNKFYLVSFHHGSSFCLHLLYNLHLLDNKFTTCKRLFSHH